MNPAMVACPNCFAAPGQPCTRPTTRGRATVTWFHSSREDFADEFARRRETEGRLTRVNQPESFTARSLKRQLESLHRGVRIEQGERYTTARAEESSLLIKVSDLETLTGMIHDLINEGAI